MRGRLFLFLGAVALAGSGLMAQTNALQTRIEAQQAVVAQVPGSANGRAWLELAVLRQDAAQFGDAENAYRKAVSLLKDGDRMTLASALDHFGTMHVEMGQFAKAEPLERKALAMRLDAGDKRAIGISYAHLAVLEFGKRDLGLAETNAEMAVSLLAPERRSDATADNATPEEQMSALIDLSLVRCAKGRCGEAKPEIKRALAVAHAHYAADSVPVGFLDYLTGYAEWKSGDPAAAAAPMERGIKELGTQLGWGHPTFVAALSKYEVFLKQTGRRREAAEVAARLARFGNPHGRSNPSEQRAANSLSLLR